jgi:membrane associated rhomboid family serine protease
VIEKMIDIIDIIDKIKYRFKSATIAEQIIYINVAVFLLTLLSENFIFNWFSLPAGFQNFISKPWVLISYGFIHGGFLHLLFNLILLFYFGNLFLDFFSKKQFLHYYLLGIMGGGVVFMLSYTYFPALKNETTFLVGASAGVTAIIVGLAARVPNYAMHFRFIGAIKLWHIAAFFVVLDIIRIPLGVNTGGYLAHLGGALVGFLLTTQFQNSKQSSSLFSSLFKSKKQQPLKTVYKKSNSSSTVTNDTNKQQKIDTILDKISKSGYETLTKEEKEFLFSVGKK